MSLRKTQSELHEKVDASISAIVATLGAIAAASRITESHQSAADALSIRVHGDAIVTHVQSLLDVLDAVRMNRVTYDSARIAASIDDTKFTLRSEYSNAMSNVIAERSQLVQSLDTLSSFDTNGTPMGNGNAMQD